MADHRPPPPGGGKAAPRSEAPQAGKRPGDDEHPLITELPYLPRPRPHVARVVVYRNGEHTVLWPDGRRHVSLRHPAVVYEVDLGLRAVTIEADLPSKGDVFSFHASISLQWRVIDPSATVRSRPPPKVEDALTPRLLRYLRATTRLYDITQSERAENAINDRLDGEGTSAAEPADPGGCPPRAADARYLGTEHGLRTQVIVQLRLDDATIDHVTKMKKLDQDIAIERKTQELREIEEQNKRQIMAARITDYKEIISAGDVARFAMQLASNPDDIAAIDTIIREDEAARRNDTIRFVSDMVEAGVIEPWEVSDQARATLQWLKAATTRVIRGDPEKQLEPPPRERRRGRDSEGSSGDVTSDGRPDGTVEGQVIQGNPETGSGHQEPPAT